MKNRKTNTVSQISSFHTGQDKPAFPEPAPVITLGPGIKATLMSDFDRYSNGSIMMGCTHCNVQIDGKDVGSVDCAITGTAVGVTIGRRTYSIEFDQLFAAVMAADEQQREREDSR